MAEEQTNGGWSFLDQLGGKILEVGGTIADAFGKKLANDIDPAADVHNIHNSPENIAGPDLDNINFVNFLKERPDIATMIGGGALLIGYIVFRKRK